MSKRLPDRVKSAMLALLLSLTLNGCAKKGSQVDTNNSATEEPTTIETTDYNVIINHIINGVYEVLESYDIDLNGLDLTVEDLNLTDEEVDALKNGKLLTEDFISIIDRVVNELKASKKEHIASDNGDNYNGDDNIITSDNGDNNIITSDEDEFTVDVNSLYNRYDSSAFPHEVQADSYKTSDILMIDVSNIDGYDGEDKICFLYLMESISTDVSDATLYTFTYKSFRDIGGIHKFFVTVKIPRDLDSKHYETGDLAYDAAGNGVYTYGEGGPFDYHKRSLGIVLAEMGYHAKHELSPQEVAEAFNIVVAAYPNGFSSAKDIDINDNTHNR